MINKFVYYLKCLNERQILLLLVGVTFALRLYAVLMAQGIANDSVAYGFMARDFLQGRFIEGLSSPAPPFYPFLIYLLSPGTPSIETAGRLLSLFFGTLSVIPLFYLVKETVGQREAIFSALFYSFHPYLVTYSGMLLTEPTYWGLLVLSVYFFWTGLKKQKAWRIALSGCFLGLSYLTRPEGIGYVLVYVIWIAVDGGLGKGRFRKLIHIGTLIATVFIFVVPYVIYIHQETGRWLITKKAVEVQSQLLNRVEKTNDRPPEISPEGDQSAEAPKSEVKGSTLLGMFRNVARNIPFTTYHYLRAFHFSLWLFLFFGLIRVGRKAIAYELFLACLILFHLFSLSTFTTSTSRFSVPVVALSLFWAGTGTFEIRRYLEKIKVLNPPKVMVLIIIFAILVQLPQGLRPERRHRAEQKGVGLWLKQNTPPDAIIMSNSAQETFYADREFMILPRGNSVLGTSGLSYNEIIHYAKTKGVRYILVDKNTPQLNPGFVESVESKDLKEIFRKADQGLIIYEVIY